ncbi:GntR family transcriptional regulator [Croceicoccus sp. BE223]|uniref:GntR family transcriptional regulator n=1 Tax=Croceicoccus sp. BE223 TaxID=2817716 RepID=UPI0028596610|nr:GntR family transcriptional regulator [Croceicoccus sp. BE223]MDR7101190.1 DNA-binding GntR family transcriptional regulator [Croceicoccus sp. BE223]
MSRSDGDTEAPVKTPARPRYMVLADELRDAIQAGKLSVGKQFPTEHELSATHGLSRHTVREALRRLEIEGLISRKRGSGTIIRPVGQRGGTLSQPLSNVGEILQYAHDTEIHYKPTGKGPLPRKLADVLNGSGGQWHSYHGIRIRPGDARPIAVTDAFVAAEVLRDQELSLDGVAIFRQMESLCRIRVGNITQEIQAVPASAGVAKQLDIARRSPCLRLLRCYYDTGGRLFEVSVSHHPGDRFAYSMHIDIDA